MKNTEDNLTSGQNSFTTDINPEILRMNNSYTDVAEKILGEIMNYRRLPEHSKLCRDSKCRSCSSFHLPKINEAVKSSVPVLFVLPAFPGKSPNPNKVLGVLPDYAERLSLKFLGELCENIKRFYSPGIKIILCADGTVFSDIVGIKESDITAYQVALDNLIGEMALSDISTFNLHDFYEDLSFVKMRDELMKTYAKSLAFLKDKIRNGSRPDAKPDEQDANRMYCGITRFLFEDSLYPGQTKGRSVLQRDAKFRAYELIRRSNAWSDLIAERFPDAVRLSIHPQACGAKKLGIRLVGNESWMTPWHGVALETRSGYVLIKRSEAIERGAELIHDSSGQPSHYKLTDRDYIPMEKC